MSASSNKWWPCHRGLTFDGYTILLYNVLELNIGGEMNGKNSLRNRRTYWNVPVVFLRAPLVPLVPSKCNCEDDTTIIVLSRGLLVLLLFNIQRIADAPRYIILQVQYSGRLVSHVSWFNDSPFVFFCFSVTGHPPSAGFDIVSASCPVRIKGS